MEFRQARRFTLLILAIASVFQFFVETADAYDRPIYVARNWRDYLRVVALISPNEPVPVLYSEDRVQTRGIEKFAELYVGNPIPVDSAMIHKMYMEHWRRTDMVVICEQGQHTAIVASAIAAALNVPLYFRTPPIETLRQWEVSRFITVGAVTTPGGFQKLTLDSLCQALLYYNGLAKDSSVVILAGDDDVAFLAARAIAYHSCPLVFDRDEIRNIRPRHLAWVTRPEAVTVDTMLDLYSNCSLTPGADIHDVTVGILTGLSAHDIALLMARSYSYSELQGDWKHRLVKAPVEARSEISTSSRGPFELVTLAGDALTADTLESALQSAAYVQFCGHGNQDDIKLSDGEWRPDHETQQFSPLVFVGESCLTGKITEGAVENSIALHMIAAGAVAYVGSMEMGGVAIVGNYPFAFCTPRSPLGERVRLQNAGRAYVDAGWPRAILIGEPTFHQYQDEWIEYTVHPGDKETRVSINGSQDSVAVTVTIELPDDSRVSYAEALIDGELRQPYTHGLHIWGASMATAQAFGRQVLLLEWPGGDGQLVLYHDQPLWLTLGRLVAICLLGLKAIIDVSELSMMSGWDIAIATIIVLLIVFFKRRSAAGARRRIGLCVGAVMGLLTYLYLFACGMYLQFETAVAVAGGACTVTWIVPVERRGLQWVALSTLLFATPLLMAWLLFLAFVSSKSLLWIMACSMALVCVNYGVALIATRWVLVRVARIAKGRSQVSMHC